MPVTSIENRSDNPALEDVRSFLLAYEARLEKQTSVDQLNLMQANLSSLQLHSNSRRPTSRPSTNSSSRTPFNPPNFSFPAPQVPLINQNPFSSS